MIGQVPSYVSALFVITTLFTVGFFIYTIFQVGRNSRPTKLLSGLLIFWLTAQAALSFTGFYQNTEAMPPRIFAFGVLPALLAIAIWFLLFGHNFIECLSIKLLTLLHVVRIPVEFVLLSLYTGGLVPQIMTFEGRNFDILSGLTAPIIFLIAFRDGKVKRPLLIIWNLATLALLVNIVATAVLSFPSPFQNLGFDQPNLAIIYFPFVWLPTIVVPIVLFCHLASLYKLLRSGKS